MKTIFMTVSPLATLVLLLVNGSHQEKAASILNNAFTAGASAGGDGVALCDASHPPTVVRLLTSRPLPLT